MGSMGQYGMGSMGQYGIIWGSTGPHGVVLRNSLSLFCLYKNVYSIKV
jgi:hypothetical protein